MQKIYIIEYVECIDMYRIYCPDKPNYSIAYEYYLKDAKDRCKQYGYTYYIKL